MQESLESIANMNRSSSCSVVSLTEVQVPFCRQIRRLTVIIISDCSL